MNIDRNRIALVAATMAALPVLALADTTPTVNDYLYNLGTGPTAAHEIIQLDGSAVTNVQTAKELVLAAGAFGDPDKKKGFGIAFTPGRSRLDALAVSLRDYSDERRPFKRLWANTTFSYAQNEVAPGGSDYRQRALAINVSYYLDTAQDPIVAARNAVRDDVVSKGPCLPALTDLQVFNSAMLKHLVELKTRAGFPPGTEADAATMKRLQDEANRLAAEGLEDMLATKAREVRRGRAPTATSGATVRPLAQIAADIQACSDKARSEAEAKWNASQITLVLGKGSIQPAQGGTRLGLGTHAALALAYGHGDTGLLNLTLRRIRRELDTDTLTTTPGYKNTSIAAIRYTYGQPGRDTFGLVEWSNVKKNSNTASNGAFKQAIGIDHKLAAGLWLEFRYGRARVFDGTTMENKALLNLKFSPESTLDKESS